MKPAADVRAFLKEQLSRLIEGKAADEQLRILEWAERAVEGDDIDRGLLDLALNGEMDVLWPSDATEPRFRQTELGRDRTMDLFHDSADARAMLERLTGRPVLDPPKEKQ